MSLFMLIGGSMQISVRVCRRALQSLAMQSAYVRILVQACTIGTASNFVLI